MFLNNRNFSHKTLQDGALQEQYLGYKKTTRFSKKNWAEDLQTLTKFHYMLYKFRIFYKVRFYDVEIAGPPNGFFNIQLLNYRVNK